MNDIKDLLTKTIDQLTSITDGSTSADKAYMQDQIFGILKAIGTSNFNNNHLIISSSDYWPSYSSLQDLLNSNNPTINERTCVFIKENLTNEITSSKPYFFIYSPSKNLYSINININEVDSMYFKDITIILNTNVTLIGCNFENCIINGAYGVALKDGNIFKNCTFNNDYILNIGSFSSILNSEFYVTNDIDLNYLQELTFCKLNKLPLNESTIVLNNLNIITV